MGFAHDARFVRGPAGAVYSRRGAFPWDRYLEVADSLVVMARMEDAVAGEDLSRVERVDHPRVEFRAVPSLSGPVAAVAARAEAQRRVAAALDDADVLVARLPSEIGMVAARYARRRGMPWLAEVVTCAWDTMWNYGNWQGRVYAPLFALRTRAAVRGAPYALYVTKEFLQRRYPTRGESIACSDVDVEPPDPAVQARRMARIDSSPDPLVTGTIAALLPFKGLDTAFEALARARPKLPPVELRILGAGDQAPWRALAARHGVADIVHFDGTLPAGEPVRRWLDEVDVYIQPSRQEGLPRALVEAMSRGCPAVGSTAGGIGELLDGDCLHAPGDAEALATLLAAAVDGGWQRVQARRNLEVAAAYSAPVLAAARAGFLRRLVHGHTVPVTFVQAHAQRGGSERYLELLLDCLGDGWVDEVVCLQDGPLVEILRRRGHSVTVLEVGATLGALVQGAWRLRRHVRGRVVHANGVKAALVAGLGLVGTRRRVVWVKHDYSWDGPIGLLVWLLVERVVGVSRAVVSRLPRRRVEVVHPGIPAMSVERTAEGGPTVGVVGRFHQAKGQLEALEAWPLVREALPTARLVLIGGDDSSTPDYAAAVRSRAAELGDGVELLGHRHDVPALLAGLDVVLVPSGPDERGMGREGFGLVAVEAMAVGTPVVAYAAGAVPEVVGDAGLLVPPGDRQALADAVVRLATDRALAVDLAARGRERAQRFSLERTAEGMAACYRRLAR